MLRSPFKEPGIKLHDLFKKIAKGNFQVSALAKSSGQQSTRQQTEHHSLHGNLMIISTNHQQTHWQPVDGYSRELKDLTQNMINVDPTARPEMKVLACFCISYPWSKITNVSSHCKLIT